MIDEEKSIWPNDRFIRWQAERDIESWQTKQVFKVFISLEIRRGQPGDRNSRGLLLNRRC